MVDWIVQNEFLKSHFCHIRHVDNEEKYECIFDISWNIEDIEYIVMLIYTLYWIYIYGILLLYHVCTWICLVYANALDVYLSDLYKTIAVFLYTSSVGYTNTSRWERKWNVVCCAVSLWDLHVPVTDCYTVLDAWMRRFSLCYQRAREHLWHCVSLSVKASVLRGEQHTPQRGVNV